MSNHQPSFDLIYHLTPAGHYRRQAEDQPYVSATLAEEGFIHATAERNLLLRVANAYFADLDEPLLVLVINPDRLTSPLKFEPPSPLPGTPEQAGYARRDRLFPHIYGPLNREAIVAECLLQRDPTGAWRWPGDEQV